jgi:hypothetical protein
MYLIICFGLLRRSFLAQLTNMDGRVFLLGNLLFINLQKRYYITIMAGNYKLYFIKEVIENYYCKDFLMVFFSKQMVLKPHLLFMLR